MQAAQGAFFVRESCCFVAARPFPTQPARTAPTQAAPKLPLPPQPALDIMLVSIQLEKLTQHKIDSALGGTRILHCLPPSLQPGMQF